MLRVCPVLELSGHQFLSMDERRKQVTVYDPASCGITTAANRRPGMISAPKMFAFDAVFSQDDALVSSVILFVQFMSSYQYLKSVPLCLCSVSDKFLFQLLLQQFDAMRLSKFCVIPLIRKFEVSTPNTYYALIHEHFLWNYPQVNGTEHLWW